MATIWTIITKFHTEKGLKIDYSFEVKSTRSFEFSRINYIINLLLRMFIERMFIVHALDMFIPHLLCA
jgi:hypothetical protein